MRALALCLILFSGVPTALAHGDAQHSAQGAWTLDPWILLPLISAIALYTRGALALSRRLGRGRQVLARRTAVYVLGWVTLAGALVSPLHALGERCFTLHMIEHEIMMALAAPLLVLARPIGVFLWALPSGVRHRFPPLLRSSLVRRGWQRLTGPGSSTAIHGLVIWLWHVPWLFDAAVTQVAVHRVQHLSFLLSALLFWWSLVRRSNAGTAAWYLILTMLHTSILGALIALAPRVLYEPRSAETLPWGLTPLQDQQLAGMIMWVPAGVIYGAAALLCAALWIRHSSGALSGALAPGKTLARS